VNDRPPRVHPLVDRLGAYSWRLIGIGIVLVALAWLLSRMRVVVIPVVVALFLTRALAPVAGWLRRRGWRPGLAAAVSLLAFFVVLGGLSAAIAPSLADEAESLGPTLTEAIDDVEDWIVEDGPFEVSRGTVDRLRERTGERLDALRRESDGAVLEGATLVAEIVAGLILALLLTFFMLRDGARFAAWAIGRARPERRVRLRRAAEGGWTALGGYLRGAALLGVLEAVVIGITLFAVGGGLVAPVMLLTFTAAFIPLVGAVAAGVVATLVALVTAGTIPALIVAVVALVVQQLDNDVLAPVIYGRSLSLHPVVVLLSLVAGGALFGFGGTVLAVPLVAVTVNAIKQFNRPEEFGGVSASATSAPDG
jgi:predicted PurR-regulated permease PerM